MKYTLQENAMSSFSLAIENFKKFYYNANMYSESELDEARKLCAIFLENSIELFLKALLVKHDEKSIYVHPESEIIREAQEKAHRSSESLEDILIEEGIFLTIKYSKTIEEYCSLYNSDIVRSTFMRISEYRNKLTHFGIKTDDNDEFTVACVNVFGVIYQNIFEKLLDLEKIADYLVDDGLIVKTIHGYKPIFNEDCIYNNIIDFLDELVDYVPVVGYENRITNSFFKIQDWIEFYDDMIQSNNFHKMIDYYGVTLTTRASLIIDNCMEFVVSYKDNNEEIDEIIQIYCPYYNATFFTDYNLLIFFVIKHSLDKIIIYNDDIYMPSMDDPQLEEVDLDKHIENGHAKIYKLTKRNLLQAFDTSIRRIKELEIFNT